MRCNLGLLRLAPQDVDCAAGKVVLGWLLREKRSVVWVCNDACRFVPMKRTLKRAHQQIAFRTVVIDDTETAVAPVVLRLEVFTNRGEVGNLSLNNKELVALNLVQPNLVQLLKWESLPRAVLQFPLHAFKDGLVLVEVLAHRAVGNLFSRTLFDATADVPKLGYIARADSAFEFRAQFIEVSVTIPKQRVR